MDKEGSYHAIRSARIWTSIRYRRILAACGTFLAAVALTYGWDALFGATSAALAVPFALRAALSTILIFLGAFVVTGLWSLPSSDLRPAMSMAPANSTQAARGETAPADADPVPVHVPVSAADLPRILFDTNEYPTITSPQKDTKTSSRPTLHPPLRPPVAWPQHPPADGDE